MQLQILHNTVYEEELSEGSDWDVSLEMLHPFIVSDGLGNSEVAQGAALKQVRRDSGKTLPVSPRIFPETDPLAIAEVECYCSVE